MPISAGCSSVAHYELPTADAAAPMAGGTQRAEPYANQNRDRRVTRISTFGLLAYQLADLGRHNGNQVDGQRAACTAQLIGGTAHGNQAEQHKLRYGAHSRWRQRGPATAAA